MKSGQPINIDTSELQMDAIAHRHKYHHYRRAVSRRCGGLKIFEILSIRRAQIGDGDLNHFAITPF